MELDEITYPISKKSLGKLPELLEQQRKTLTDMGLAPEERVLPGASKGGTNEKGGCHAMALN